MNPESTKLEAFLHVFRKHFTWFLFVFFFLLYAATAQRGVSWQDSGEFQYRVLVHDYVWISGIARAHPAYIAGAQLFLKLFPASCRFYALNLFSGLGMSLALFFLARLLSSLKLKPATILITVLTLGLSHMVWWMSTVAEVYTWSLAFLMAELLCVAKLCEEGSGFRIQGSRFRVLGSGWMLLALLNGLHASLHNFAFLNLPVYALLFVYLHRQNRFWQGAVTLLASAGSWLLGACLLLALFKLEWATTHAFGETLKSLLFGREYKEVVLGMRSINWPLVKMNVALAGLSLLNPAWVFVFFAGRTRTQQACFKGALLGLTATHVLFWIRYFVPDQATFLLPSLALLAIWTGIGLDSLQLRRHALRGIACLVILAAVMMPLLLQTTLKARGVDIKRTRELPFRDEAGYWLFPWKHNEDSAVRFVERIRSILKDDDVLIADHTAGAPLMAAQAAGLLSSNLCIIAFRTEAMDEQTLCFIEATERVYIVSPVAGYAPPEVLSGRFTFEKEDILYRVRSARHE